MYGAATFWTMKAVSLVGIILAVVALGKCTAEVVTGNVDVSIGLWMWMWIVDVNIGGRKWIVD